MTYHANARLTQYQRKMIKKSRAPYRVLASQLGVSVTTVAKWKKRTTMSDKNSRPHTIHKALPADVEPVLEFLRRDWLMDMDTIWLALKKTVFPQLSKSAVYRQLVRQQINNLKELRPSRKRSEGRFPACPPGFIHIDVFRLPKLGNKKLYVFIAIDRATRLMTLRAYDNRRKETGLIFLKHCQSFFPFKIYRILTDNGGEFTNKHYKKNSKVRRPRPHPFGTACQETEIQHVVTKAYHPWTNGLAERTIQTVKNDTVYRLHYNSQAELISALYGFERFFNCHRPYKAMGSKTPEELAAEWFTKQPEIFTKEPAMLFTTL